MKKNGWTTKWQTCAFGLFNNGTNIRFGQQLNIFRPQFVFLSMFCSPSDWQHPRQMQKIFHSTLNHMTFLNTNNCSFLSTLATIISSVLWSLLDNKPLLPLTAWELTVRNWFSFFSVFSVTNTSSERASLWKASGHSIHLLCQHLSKQMVAIVVCTLACLLIVCCWVANSISLLPMSPTTERS